MFTHSSGRKNEMTPKECLTNCMSQAPEGSPNLAVGLVKDESLNITCLCAYNTALFSRM